MPASLTLLWAVGDTGARLFTGGAAPCLPLKPPLTYAIKPYSCGFPAPTVLIHSVLVLWPRPPVPIDGIPNTIESVQHMKNDKQPKIPKVSQKID